MSMATNAPGSARFRMLRLSASRLGQDAVWLAIAGLFCVVEGAVKLSELRPTRWLRPLESSGDHPTGSGRRLVPR